MLKGIIATCVVGAVIAAIAIVVTVEFGLVAAGADVRPGSIEEWAAMTSLHARIDRNAPKGPNPLDVSDENLIAGIRIYSTHCAVCHGAADGRPSAVADGLYEKPPQLARDGVEDDPAGHTFWKVEHGIRWTGMPSFGGTLSEQQIWQVTLFLEKMDRLPPAAQDVWQQVPSEAAGATGPPSAVPARPAG